MKRDDRGLAFGLGLFLLLLVPVGRAYQPNPSDSDKWMLEITRPGRGPDYQPMSDGEEAAWTVFNDLDWQPGWDGADQSHPLPTGLGFNYRIQGTEARVRVFLQFGSPESRGGSREELTVGNYMLHIGESVTVSQLSEYGLEPVHMKLVTARPPEAVVPEIINETPSMVVENVDQDQAEYRLLLRNTSNLAVDAIVVSVFDREGRCQMHNQRGWSAHFIPAGSSRELELGFPIAKEDAGVVGADRKSCSNSPRRTGESSGLTPSGGARSPRIVIEAVVFQDGSYEGHKQKAALLEAERLGREFQRSRITALVEEHIKTNQPDGMAKLISAQLQVSALPENVDPAKINSLMARFPAELEGAQASVAREVQNGLRMEKGTFLRNLQLYLMELSNGEASEPSLQHWWQVTKGTCDFLVPQVCPEAEQKPGRPFGRNRETN